MKLVSSLGLFGLSVFGDDPVADPGDDIRYTRCQQEIFAKQGIIIPDSHVIDTEESCDERALDNTVPKWDLNYNAEIDKFEVPYCFDGTHTDAVEATIIAKLDEFARDTCVKMVNTPSNDCRQGSVA